ncbi:MAG: LytR/AlgR family response regulator transcription factor [Candidatus Eisenbacteria bacterium]
MIPPDPLRVLIVDDEEPARSLLREYLAEIDGVVVVGECANGFEAVKAVGEKDPDLILLDIQMPKLDGFEVIELLDREVPAVFVTAHDSFSIRAFEVHAVDYLLKPVGLDRLREAVERGRQRAAMLREMRASRGPGGGGEAKDAVPAAGESIPPLPETQAAREIRRSARPLERVLIRDGSRVSVVPADAILFAEAQDDFVRIVTAEESHLKQQTLNDLEASLDPRRFVRIHRSFLLNLSFLARIEPFTKDSRVAVLRDGTQLPVSRTGYERLRRLL